MNVNITVQIILSLNVLLTNVWAILKSLTFDCRHILANPSTVCDIVLFIIEISVFERSLLIFFLNYNQDMWRLLGSFFSEAEDVSRRLNVQLITFYWLLGETVIDLIFDLSFLWVCSIRMEINSVTFVLRMAQENIMTNKRS